MVAGRLRRLIRAERRRLRRKFIRKVSERDYGSFDHWLDGEFWRCVLPLVPALIVGTVEGDGPTAELLLFIGLPLTIAWGAFVAVNVLSVYGRYGDKKYMLVTRKMLSKEYRRDR